MTIRHATPNDINAITAIYNDAVLTTTAIWNETPVSIDNRLSWLSQRQKAGFPVLVASDDATHTILGYATFGEWRAFSGYRHTVEHSIYVDKEHRGRGVGKRLLQSLIEYARTNHKHVMIAGIESGNTPSIVLHEKLGFIQTGHMPQVGHKFERWLDLTFLQLIL